MSTIVTQPIYIVVSQTGTILSRLLQKITGAQYNHVSISLESDLDTMYSFGRRNPYNPFWGGFVQESPEHGTFKRFTKTEVIVLELSVDPDTYSSMKAFLDAMYRNKKLYHYNYVGLVLAAFHICYAQHNRYYCSEFVRDILLRFRVVPDRHFRSIPQPIHFLDLPSAEVVYRGKLKHFAS